MRWIVMVLVLAGCSVPMDSHPRVLGTTTTTTSTTLVLLPAATSTATTAAPRPEAWVEPLAACESTGDVDGKAPHAINTRAVSKTGRYRNAFQFTRHMWRSMGGSGDPIAAGWREQWERATRLRYEEDPRRQWPTCWPLLFGRKR